MRVFTLVVSSLCAIVACEDPTASVAASPLDASSQSDLAGDARSDAEGPETVAPSDGGAHNACPLHGTPPAFDNAPALGEGCEAQPVAEALELSEAEVNGSAFVYTRPQEAESLLLLFHGGGGDRLDMVTRLEALLFAREAAAMGMAVASLDSQAHIAAPEGPKFKWNSDETPCNPDVVNVTAMVKRLFDPQDLAVVPEGAPIFALGASNGGSMVSRVAQHMTVSAVAIYISNAQSFHVPGASIPPVVIVAGVNDSTVGPEGPCMLYDKATVVDFHVNWSEPLTPGLFTRIPGVDCALSREIFVALKDNGLLLDSHLLADTPEPVGTWTPLLPAAAEPFVAPIRDLLLERFGEHAFSSDFNGAVLEFLMSHATASLPQDLPVCETP